jgi:hypothetical protein
MKSIIQEYLLFESPEKIKGRYIKLLQFIDLQKNSSDKAIQNSVIAAKARLADMKSKYSYLKDVALPSDHYKKRNNFAGGGRSTGRNWYDTNSQWNNAYKEKYRTNYQAWEKEYYSNIRRKSASGTAVAAIYLVAFIWWLNKVLQAITAAKKKNIYNSCLKLKGKEKQVCILKIQISSKKQQIKHLKTNLKKCKKTTNPEKCIKHVKKLLNKREIQLETYNKKLFSIKKKG